MDKSELNALVGSWESRIEELEEEREERQQQQDPMVKADTPAVREQVSFDLQVNVLERCIEEVEDCTSTDEVLETLGEWRDEVEERDKRIPDSNEWFRNHYTRLQLEECVDDLTEALPECALWRSSATHERQASLRRLPFGMPELLSHSELLLGDVPGGDEVVDEFAQLTHAVDLGEVVLRHRQEVALAVASRRALQVPEVLDWRAAAPSTPSKS